LRVISSSRRRRRRRQWRGHEQQGIWGTEARGVALKSTPTWSGPLTPHGLPGFPA